MVEGTGASRGKEGTQSTYTEKDEQVPDRRERKVAEKKFMKDGNVEQRTRMEYNGRKEVQAGRAKSVAGDGRNWEGLDEKLKCRDRDRL